MTENVLSLIFSRYVPNERTIRSLQYDLEWHKSMGNRFEARRKRSRFPICENGRVYKFSTLRREKALQQRMWREQFDCVTRRTNADSLRVESDGEHRHRSGTKVLLAQAEKLTTEL